MDVLGLHAQAVSASTRANDMNWEDSFAFFNRARTNYYLGNLHEALADYSQVIELTPDDAEAFNNRGLAYDALKA